VSSFRRWYFYVVSAISLQAVTWAAIALLRNLLVPLAQRAGLVFSPQAESVAFEISVILIGLPMFLLHWRWAGRESGQNTDGRFLPERFLYLYVMIGAFLIPLISNADGFLQSALRLVSGTPPQVQFSNEFLPDGTRLIYTAVAVLVLSLMLLYHARMLQEDRHTPSALALTAPLHRLFIYLFSAAGLLMTSIGAAIVLQWLFLVNDEKSGLVASRNLVNGLALLIAGLILWLFFWRRAQQLYRSGGIEEQRSLLRKFYLYAVIFLAVYATIAALTAVLASIFRQVLGLEPRAGSAVVISALIVGAVVWVYHALVLREDTRRVPMREEQAGLRRLYRYLVAGVGLLVLLIGLGGLLGVLFDPSPYIIDQQREDLAWFAAMILSGLAVWIIPWRSIQKETAESTPLGVQARSSIVRRFYLFFFLLLATLTFLITAVFILSRLLLAILGEPQAGGDLRTLALAGAYAIIAAAVWLYHGWLLRGDQEALEEAQDQRAAQKNIVVFGDDSLAEQLLNNLQEEFPQSHIDQVSRAGEKTAEKIAAADILIGSWTMAAAGGDLGAAINASGAQKLILPDPTPGWQWTSVGKWESETAVRQAVETLETIIDGETAVPRYTLTPGVIILLIAATILILILLTSLLGSVLPIFG
jgi:FtsH-binding integral membrane protein